MIQSMSVYERLMWKFAWDSGLQLPFPWHNTRYGFTVRPRLVVMDDSTNSDKTLRLRFHGPGSVLSLLTKSDSADLAGWESCHDRNDGWLRRHPRIFRVFKILLKKKKNQRSKIMGHCLPSNSVISGRVNDSVPLLLIVVPYLVDIVHVPQPATCSDCIRVSACSLTLIYYK